jgi:hypothetical protein
MKEVVETTSRSCSQLSLQGAFFFFLRMSEGKIDYYLNINYYLS